jgi:nucleotide-binding universal stress UspA family protein
LRAVNKYNIFQYKKSLSWIIAHIYIKLNKFRKILVTVDGSSQSTRAVDYAIEIAQKYDSELIALYVLFSKIGFAFYTETATGLVTPSSIDELIDQAKKEAEKWFGDIRKKCYSTKLQVKTEAVITAISIIEAIISYSEKEKIDIIIAGSRGRSAFKKLILGSTASGIMTYAHCPVMIIK